MGDFLHAVRVFGDHLAAVEWQFLALALALHLARLLFRAFAWRTILRAAYPGERVRFRSVFGAYMAGVGVNSVVPARGGDLVKLYLIKHRLPEASYATLAPTLVAETIVDFFVSGALIAWALVIGALPAAEVYAKTPSVDWGFFVRHREYTAAVLFFVLAAAVIGFFHFVEHGGELQTRLKRGFAILGQPRRFALGVVVPQLVALGFRIASLYYFLRAFGVHASIHNSLLTQVVDSLATLFPATPGGAGTKQGLIVLLFRGEAETKSLLLAFSVGMNIAIVVFSLAAGLLALFLMARTLSWKRIRHRAQAQDEAPAA
jgi:uncharacterized membrane protein YbhN (UPF0104 family)